jgi:cardiolipin synthase A/B
MRFSAGNQITLLKNGEAFFPRLIAAIDAAQIEVRLETYIFEYDKAGIAVADAMMRAAQRGVRVRVLVDGFGSRDMPIDWQVQMRRTGVVLLFFRPERGLFVMRKNRIRRLHRKIVLIDAHVGFVGGINIIDDFTENASTTDPASPRFDYAVEVRGPVLAEIYPHVLRLWRTVSLLAARETRVMPTPPGPVPNHDGPHRLAFLVRDNLLHRRDIERAYLQAIVAARQSVLIASPYFLPGARLRRALKAASKRGVQVTLLLQGAADHALMQMATHSLYDELLDAGITIFEYQPAMLHGKVAVVDEAWSTVGSSNLDPFSLLLNREANVVCGDRDFALTLRASIEDEIARNAVRCLPEQWRRRGWWQRVRSAFALLIARVVTSIVGVRHD